MPVINVKSAKSGGTRRPLAAGEWEARLEEVNAKESSQKKTPFVELVWKIVDSDAESTDGSAYRGKVWDQLYVTDKSFFRVLKAASELEVDLGLPDDEEVDVDVQDLVEAFRDAVGSEATVVVKLEDDQNGKTYDGTDEVKQYVRVAEYK